jgi:hypothetical protein
MVWYVPSLRSVGNSGGIFNTVPVPGSHLSRALWAGTPRLLVSIIAFDDAACIIPQEPEAVKRANRSPGTRPRLFTAVRPSVSQDPHRLLPALEHQSVALEASQQLPRLVAQRPHPVVLRLPGALHLVDHQRAIPAYLQGEFHR